eukprot:COSAG02_NODE_17035_length_1033_cov_2.004283_1_plen_104_part_00
MVYMYRPIELRHDLLDLLRRKHPSRSLVSCGHACAPVHLKPDIFKCILCCCGTRTLLARYALLSGEAARELSGEAARELRAPRARARARSRVAYRGGHTGFLL